VTLPRRLFLRLEGGRLGQPTISADPWPRGWYVRNSDDGIGSTAVGFVEPLDIGGYRWTSGVGASGTCLTLVEAIAQLVRAEVAEVMP
jgi:hypothetical protein